jgi:hypothetical protein
LEKENVKLAYGALGAKATDPKQPLINNISAVVQIGANLWLASDEGETIERLSWSAESFTDGASFKLDRYFPLSDKPKEIDVEALAISGTDLWIAGSHSLVRKGVAQETLEFAGDDHQPDPLVRLSQIRRRPRRYLLGKLPLTENGKAIGRPADGHGLCVPFSAGGNALIDELADDPHLGPFLTLPDKENGLDIEGLAVAGNRALLGLRGPTIRGFAIVIELRPEERDGALHLRQIGPNGKRYRKHFLDLAGLGIRDMTAHGDDLVIIAGPTMGLSAPWAVLRWRNGLVPGDEGIVDKAALVPVMPIEPQNGDHPEGITAFRHPDGRTGWLVVYDHPDPLRLNADGTYLADFFF